MRKQRRIEGLTGKRLGAAIVAIFLLTVVSRQNAYIAGAVVVALISIFVIMKYRRTDYIQHFDSPEELCEVFCENRKSFAHFVGNIFDRIGYIVEMAPSNVKTSVDMKLWRDGKEYLVTVFATDADTMIDRNQIMALHLDMVDCDSDAGFIATTGCFDEEIAQFALQYDIVLLDPTKLLSYISVSE